MEMIRKEFSVVSKAIDIEAGIFEATITTEAVDRGGDVVVAAGAKIDAYLKNPVVMWAHDYSQPPVAKTTSLKVIPGNGIQAQFQFPEWGVSEQADLVRRLWAGGFLNATSIGFIPLASEDRKDADAGGWSIPQVYNEWEMLEFSIVPIPANQEALRLAVKQVSQEEKLPGEKPDDGAGDAEPNTDPTPNNESEAKLAQLLHHFIEFVKEVLK